MIYNYQPNSFSKKNIDDKQLDENIFLSLQCIYKNSLEEIIKKTVSIDKIDKNIETLSFEVPTDLDDNSFYCHFSKLGSKYFYIRNNFHVEKLDDKDLDVLKNSLFSKELLSEEFILRTLKNVIFEDGDLACMGNALPKYFAPSKSLVFTFAFNSINLELSQQKQIIEKYDEAFKSLKDVLESKLNVPIYKIVYDGLEPKEEAHTLKI